MTPSSRSRSDSATPGAGSLEERMRRLGERLSRQAPPPEMVREMAEALDRWERRLEAATSAMPEASPPRPAAAPRANLAGGGDEPIRIWCDGSCSPNPGPGGWGAIVERAGAREELCGASPASTNNIMEMTAAIEALASTPPGARVQVTTDSRYLVDGITRWLPGWKRKGWRKADGEPVLNRELWVALDRLVTERRVTWAWVRGHTGHPENERCDQLANRAREDLMRE